MTRMTGEPRSPGLIPHAFGGHERPDDIARGARFPEAEGGCFEPQVLQRLIDPRPAGRAHGEPAEVAPDGALTNTRRNRDAAGLVGGH